MSSMKKPTQILNYLYLGGKSDAKAKDVLNELNIKYILNCTPQRTDDPEFGCPNFYQKEKSFVYKRIPIFDNKGEDILTYMDAAFRFIEEGRHYGNVLVHCHKGVSRSASFVIGYLMRKNEFTFTEALDFVKMARPIVQPNEAFVEQLSTYLISSTADETINGAGAGSSSNLSEYVGVDNGPACMPSQLLVTDIPCVESEAGHDRNTSERGDEQVGLTTSESEYINEENSAASSGADVSNSSNELVSNRESSREADAVVGDGVPAAKKLKASHDSI